MRLIYLHHSGFVCEADGFSIVIDYYRDTDPNRGYVRETLLKRPGTLYVLASHFHPDHFNPDVLRWKTEKADIRYVLSEDILRQRRAKAEDALFLRKGETYQDEHLRIHAYGSTDIGISFLIEVKGKRIFHAGDLNNWHWQDESTPAEAADAERRFLQEVDALAKDMPSLDVALFPVDPRLGSDFDRGACQFINRIPTSLFIPMHYWEYREQAAAFAPYATSKGVRFLLPRPGESIPLE